MRKLLCYGDSNTWGQKSFVWEKYPDNLIWTSLIEKSGSVTVLNEGLCGRTAGDIDLERPFHNGLSHFLSHAYSKWPFDALIIALGTNDLQARFARSAKDIYSDLMSYFKKLAFMEEDDGITNLDVCFMTPPMLNKEVGRGESFEEADKKIIELKELLISNQSVLKYSVIDITGIQVRSDDGLHFSPHEHQQVADEVSKRIFSCLAEV